MMQQGMDAPHQILLIFSYSMKKLKPIEYIIEGKYYQ